VEVSQLQTIVGVLQETLVQAAEIQREKMAVEVDIVAVGNIVVGTVAPVAQRRVVVKHKAVGKLPQAAHTVLGRMSHNPHLVECHNWH
jgi:hypothetical protein